jgi:hypothetical protein
MNPISYNDIDQTLLPWAAERGLHVYTECKGEEVRHMIFVDQWGDQYGLYAIPDYDNGNKTIAVGADLEKRASKMHTFYRERKQYHFRKSTDLSAYRENLDAVWRLTNEWGQQYHA